MKSGRKLLPSQRGRHEEDMVSLAIQVSDDLEKPQMKWKEFSYEIDASDEFNYHLVYHEDGEGADSRLAFSTVEDHLLRA